MGAMEIKAQTWRVRLAQQRASGLPVMVWCRSNGCSRHSFYRWQARLRLSPEGIAQPGDKGLGLGSELACGASSVAGFTEVLVGSPPAVSPAGQSLAPQPLRLRLIGGRELILPASMPALSLAQLIHAIEALPTVKDLPALEGLPWVMEACPELVEGGRS